VGAGVRRRSRANIAFSVFAGLASLAIAVVAAAKGAWVVTGVWGLLAIGFAFRART
jgi:uncharacterized membrane protein